MENPTNRDPIGVSTIDDEASPFGPIIYGYSRAQAIADGVLVDVSTMAREAGFTVPVAMTSAAWADFVEWSDQDSRRQTHQDETGRLWDVCVCRTWRPGALREEPWPSSYTACRVAVKAECRARRPCT